MEEKFHGLPPLKRFRLMQQQEQSDVAFDTVASSLLLPAKKRKESRDSSQPIPTNSITTTAYCLPAKKRVWALQPDLFPDRQLSPFDLNVEYKPVQEEEEVKADFKKPQLNNDNNETIEHSKEDKKSEEQEEDDDDDDDGIICAICQSTDGDPIDPIVLCDGCDLMVHTTCYGNPLIKGIPDGEWFCNQCQFLAENETKALSCCLCPSNRGAMKPTNDDRWAHVVCALFVPEVFFEDSQGRDGIDCSKTAPKRWEGECYVCHSTSGCVIDCSEPKCHLAFHVTCGLKEELYLEYREGRRKGAIVAGFCKDHTDLWKKQEQTGKFKIVAREERNNQ